MRQVMNIFAASPSVYAHPCRQNSLWGEPEEMNLLLLLDGMGKEEMKACLASVREQMAEESKSYPDTPLSYAVGFALASEFPGSTMQEMFNYADKNMYINKNHVKREEQQRKDNWITSC